MGFSESLIEFQVRFKGFQKNLRGVSESFFHRIFRRFRGTSAVFRANSEAFQRLQKVSWTFQEVSGSIR